MAELGRSFTVGFEDAGEDVSKETKDAVFHATVKAVISEFAVSVLRWRGARFSSAVKFSLQT